MRPTHVLLATLVLCVGTLAQTIPNGYVWSYYQKTGAAFTAPGGGASTYANNVSSGTVCNQLVKQDGSGNAVVTSGGETMGIIGVATAGCGTAGAVIVFYAGDQQIIFDTSSATVSDYVGVSNAAGHVTDVGSTPGSGQNIGQVRNDPYSGAAPANCNVAPGCYVHLEIGNSGGGGGGGGGSCAGCVQLNPIGNQTIAQPNGSILTVTAPIAVLASGSVNGVTVPDSGSAGQTLASNNSAAFVSGTTPSPSTCYTGSNIFQPLFSAKVSNVTYSTGLESFCNKDQLGGYPSLDPTFGIIPLQEIVKNTSGCNSSTVIAGDQSACISSSNTQTWAQIPGPGVGLTSTNTGPGTFVVGFGLLLTAGAAGGGGGGHINADQLNNTSWPTGSIGGALNAVDSFPVVVSSTGTGSTFGATVAPNCVGPGCALGYNTTTHKFTSNNVALNSAHPMIRLLCNGTNNACPSTSAVTGTGSTAIFYELTIAANQLSADGQCFDVRIRWKHSTATTTVAYSWNVGGTGAVGGAVTGGIATSTTSNNTGASAIIRSVLTVCRDSGALMTNIYTDQYQFGTASGGPGAANGAIDWTQPQQINLLFNVANTDAVTFWGGEVYYP